jgi:hypothetical protein
VTHLIPVFTRVADSLIGAAIVPDELPGVEQQRVTIARPSPGRNRKEENGR